MLRVAAHLPDAAVGLAPVGDRRLDLLLEDRPHALGQRVARLGVQVDRVEHRAPHVVLVLVVGAVADPHRPRVLVAAQVVERLLGQVGAAVDPVHDLQPALRGLGAVGDEVEEVVGLPVEAERVEAPERERGVADPGVAVVPVALAAGRLGQRGGGGGDDRAGRRVGQALERERAALQVACATGGRGSGRGRASAASGGRSTRASRRPRRTCAAAGCSLHDSAQKTCSPSFIRCRAVTRGPSMPRLRSLTRRSSRSPPSIADLVVVVAGVLPAAALAAVVEGRLAVERELDLAVDAADRAQQDVVGVVVGRRAAVRVRAVVAVVPGADQQHVADDDPAAAGAPARLQDHRAGQVAARGRDVHARPGRAGTCRRRGRGSTPKTLGESIRGRHIHSTLPLGATSAVVSQSDRKP